MRCRKGHSLASPYLCSYLPIIVTIQRPTTIVPFFGDQPFWGERVQQAGVGPAPIPASAFTLERLVDAINFMMQSQVNDQAGSQVLVTMPADWSTMKPLIGFHADQVILTMLPCSIHVLVVCCIMCRFQAKQLGKLRMVTQLRSLP